MTVPVTLYFTVLCTLYCIVHIITLHVLYMFNILSAVKYEFMSFCSEILSTDPDRIVIIDD